MESIHSRIIDSEKNERAKTRIGTPRYVSPEVLKSSVGYSFPADIWSLGGFALSSTQFIRFKFILFI